MCVGQYATQGCRMMLFQLKWVVAHCPSSRAVCLDLISYLRLWPQTASNVLPATLFQLCCSRFSLSMRRPYVQPASECPGVPHFMSLTARHRCVMLLRTPVHAHPPSPCVSISIIFSVVERDTHERSRTPGILKVSLLRLVKKRRKWMS
jgi:hypothetical protein